MDDLKTICLKRLSELQEFKKNDFDVHKDNLIKKIKNTINKDKSAVFKTIEDVNGFISPYIEYRRKMELLLLSDSNINEMVMLLNDYKSIAFKINNLKGGQYFSSQSKYESTILEEFVGFLLSPLIKNISNIKCGPCEAYSEMSIGLIMNEDGESDIKLDYKTKNQDLALYREVIINEKVLQFPLVSIECKTYIDKTMLEGSINTFRRIKRGSPQSKFYILAETFDLSENESSSGDGFGLFILRKCKRRKNNEIYTDVVESLYHQIKEDLLSFKKNTKLSEEIEKTGRCII